MQAGQESVANTKELVLKPLNYGPRDFVCHTLLQATNPLPPFNLATEAYSLGAWSSFWTPGPVENGGIESQ